MKVCVTLGITKSLDIGEGRFSSIGLVLCVLDEIAETKLCILHHSSEIEAGDVCDTFIGRSDCKTTESCTYTSYGNIRYSVSNVVDSIHKLMDGIGGCLAQKSCYLGHIQTAQIRKFLDVDYSLIENGC